MRKNTEQGELAKHIVNDNGCWIWTGYTNKDGYGETSVDGKKYTLHRLSYQFHKGPLIKGMMICHTCDTPACHNPDHLYQGTSLDNNRDRAARNKEGPRKCQLTKAQEAGLDIEKINAIYVSDEYPGILAQQYGISNVTVSRIRKDQGYARLVTDESRAWRKQNPLPNFHAKSDETKRKLGAAQTAYQATLDDETIAQRMEKATLASVAARSTNNWNRYGRM